MTLKYKTSDISVVIPLYNKSATIKRSILSIMAQSGQPGKIIVVDDGSTDGSAAIVETMQVENVELVRQQNAGPGAARNHGARLAETPLIAFLDADDEWHAEYLETAIEAFNMHAEIVAYVAGFYVESGPGNLTNLVSQILSAPAVLPVPDGDGGEMIMLKTDGLHSSCTTVFRDVFLHYEGFYENRCVFGEDSYIWIQILFSGPIFWDPAGRVHYHTEDSALSSFAVNAGYKTTPVSWHPQSLLDRCRKEYLHAMKRGIAAFVKRDRRRMALAGNASDYTKLTRLHPVEPVDLLKDAARYGRGVLARVRARSKT